MIFCTQCSTRNCPRNGSQAGQRTAKKIACNNLFEPLPIGSTKQLQLRYLGHQVVLLLHEAVPFVLESFHFSIFLGKFGQQNHDVRLGLAPPDLSPTVRLHVPLHHASAIDVVSVAIRLDLKDISAIVTMPALFPAPFKCIIHILAGRLPIIFLSISTSQKLPPKFEVGILLPVRVFILFMSCDL